MRYMHSLMFGWEFPPFHSGGLGIACHGLVRGLAGNGVKLTLVLPKTVDAPDGVDILSSDTEQIDLRTVRTMLHAYDTHATYEERLRLHTTRDPGDVYGPDLGSAVEHFTAHAVSLTKDIDPDVVHCHDWMTYEAGQRAADYHDRPLVAHVHATELDRTDFQPDPWITDIEVRGLKRADRVIAVSAYTKNLLTGQYGIAHDKISVVHNAHDTVDARITPASTVLRKKGPPTILFLGRMTVQKNPWQFLEVARLLHKERPDIRFVMAGDGPMLTSLIDAACAQGLGDCVLFTGKVSRGEVESLYRDAACFVMPSLSEPFGLVALEAIAQGVPVVLSRQSGVAEVLDHAFKVDFWDTDKMADCILTILREEPLAHQLRSEAPRLLQRLTWKNQAHLVQSIYHDLTRS